MGLQNTPVLSIATWLHCCSVSQSRKRTRSAVMVLKVRRSLRRSPLAAGVMRQAMTAFLWTSRPAHRSYTICISLLLFIQEYINAGRPRDTERGSNAPIRASPYGERQTLVLGGIQVILWVRLTALVSNRPSTLGLPSLKYTRSFFMDSGARQRMHYCWETRFKLHGKASGKQ